uniref:Uncharacterized protein n=1 Tax=Arundo donax TaxID=35708 RepID=A0A0A8ZTY7_ARUDO
MIGRLSRTMHKLSIQEYGTTQPIRKQNNNWGMQIDKLNLH